MTYLFEAHFKDGTIISQTQDDVSKTDPNRSAYYDVVQHPSEVEFFVLYNDKENYTVDLKNGDFKIDDDLVLVKNNEVLPSGTKRELIFFRRHTHKMTQGVPGDEHTMEYHLGWTAMVDEKPVEQTLVIPPISSEPCPKCGLFVDVLSEDLRQVFLKHNPIEEVDTMMVCHSCEEYVMVD